MVLLEFISNFFLVSQLTHNVIKEELIGLIKSDHDLIIIDISSENIDQIITSLSKNKIQILKAKTDTISNGLINTIGYAYVNDNKTIFIIFDDKTKLRTCLTMFLQSFAGASSYKNDIDEILDMNLKSIK